MNQPFLQPSLKPYGMLLTQRMDVLLPVSKRTMIILPGIVVNGFSAPRFQYTLTGMTPFSPNLIGPSIPHDMGYGGQFPGWGKDAWDQELYALMMENQVDGLNIEETRDALGIAGFVDWNKAAADKAGQAYIRQFASIV